MTSNPKNILQEYYQSLKLPLPVYNTQKDGCMWVSTVTVFEGQFVTSNPFTSKKNAEQNAAERMYNTIILADTKCVQPSCIMQTQTDIYIDVENQSRAAIDTIKLLKKYPLPSHIVIIFAMSANCSIKERLKHDIHNLHLDNVQLIVTKSRHTNAADTLIVIQATKSLQMSDVVILSNDKFAAVFKDVIDELQQLSSNLPKRLVGIATTFNEFNLLVFSQ